MNKELAELTKEEIKKMLIVAAKNDMYSAKCFAGLILENQKSAVIEEFVDLLSCSKRKEAMELVKNNF